MLRLLACVLPLSLSLMAPADAARVRFETSLGSFEVELLEEEAPGTVANFMNYVRDGDYDGTFLHRSASGFVLQGGGFRFADGDVREVETDPPIANEFGRSNTRGTLAMAKLGGDPDSATSQWFVNLVDNGAILDESNGGFTVFGEVIGDGMQVVDGIVAQTAVWNFGGALASLPLIGYGGSGPVEAGNLVEITVTEVAEAEGFTVNPGVAGAWFDPETPGQGWLVDVFTDPDPGAEDARLELFLAWFAYDDRAPMDEDLAFGSSQHRWFTAQGEAVGDTVEMVLFRSSGGRFDHPRPTETTAVGTLTLRFVDCTTAVLAYEFSTARGGSGTIDIERLSPDVYCAAAAAAR